MLIIKTVEHLREVLNRHRRSNRRIGFVPTMGALHDGHLSLVRRAQADVEIVVCSVFVNPTQFNDADDLEKYPRTLDQDAELLIEADVDVLFLPSVKEIYPDGMDVTVRVDLNGLDEKLEGPLRPGHFDGVVQVVHRLLDIVQPYAIYMGQKDFQQVRIIERMVQNLKLPYRVVRCPIKREDSGLAMSSRNRRLSENGMQQATVLHRSLLQTKENVRRMPLEIIRCSAITEIEKAGLHPEYFSIVDAQTLEPLGTLEDGVTAVALVAAWVDGVRLIDNMILNGE